MNLYPQHFARSKIVRSLDQSAVVKPGFLPELTDMGWLLPIPSTQGPHIVFVPKGCVRA